MKGRDAWVWLRSRLMILIRYSHWCAETDRSTGKEEERARARERETTGPLARIPRLRSYLGTKLITRTTNLHSRTKPPPRFRRLCIPFSRFMVTVCDLSSIIVTSTILIKINIAKFRHAAHELRISQPCAVLLCSETTLTS